MPLNGIRSAWWRRSGDPYLSSKASTNPVDFFYAMITMQLIKDISDNIYLIIIARFFEKSRVFRAAAVFR
jgi:hypothetical protein